MASTHYGEGCDCSRLWHWKNISHSFYNPPESFVSDDFVYQCQYIWFFYLYKFESWKLLFSTVLFQMTSQKACLWYKVTLVAFNLTSPQCAFGNSFSNCLSQRMLNCKGCMVLAFLHCEFTNVALYCQNPYFFRSPIKKAFHILQRAVGCTLRFD